MEHDCTNLEYQVWSMTALILSSSIASVGQEEDLEQGFMS